MRNWRIDNTGAKLNWIIFTFQFCGKVDTLPQCELGATAYKSRTVFSKTTGEKVNQLDHVECFCPKTHTYEMANQNFGDLDADAEVMDVTYSCAPVSAPQ